jgi:hypothetical protein
MIKKILFVSAMLWSSIVYSEEWIDITSSSISTFSVKPSTVKLATNDGGVKVVMAVGRVISNDTKKIEASMWYVPLSHCAMQRGSLGITDLVGNFQTEVQFVFGLGTTGSQIAEVLCNAADNLSKTGKPKVTI